VIRQPKQENRDRTAIKDSWDNTARIGKRLKNSKNMIASTEQLRQGN
jgi:hypothetical protein